MHLPVMEPLCNENQFKSSSQVRKTSEHGRSGLVTIVEEKENETELDRLKDVTARLNLKTTRPSYIEWRQNLHKFYQKKKEVLSQNGISVKSDNERREQVARTLEWLKEELLAMKSQDHALAMQLMQLRSEIQQVKLQKSCEEHKDLIEDKRYSLTEELEDEKWGLCDLPLTNNNEDQGFADPLKDIGVTKMNLSSRRFSIF